MANNNFDLDVEVKAVNSETQNFGLFTSTCFTSQCFSSKCFTDTCFSSNCFTGRHMCGYTHGYSC
ncbi:elgicin/penisin family lantibiotic [Paenibacillus ehimensis]|uniref:Elgicin/penisin family lantibiotic n=1 Tax=Paenibacillus ehimensis TaxID=79264 RepID=A0ABT8VHF9_9BACL|nr:elgicin/penisin family lantibiotic [Paenibacillus ehimensis]MDO3680386.1 elgicin/penisin family lantibiotic [Paenibacillus ehimensis]MEC0208293.1 elgicin/penisin family lantibiotic [Paenibacillus ehimensis]